MKWKIENEGETAGKGVKDFFGEGANGGETELRWAQEGGLRVLTPRQKRFAEEYLVDLNAYQAAIRAGYAPKTAIHAGCRILSRPEVRALVDAGAQAQTRRTEITADRVLRELANVAFFDPRRLFAPDGSVLPVRELDDGTAAAVTALEVREEDGARVFRCRTADKLRALALLARHVAPAEPPTESAGVVLIPEVGEE